MHNCGEDVGEHLMLACSRIQDNAEQFSSYLVHLIYLV